MNKSPNVLYVGDEVDVQVGTSRRRGTIVGFEGRDTVVVRLPNWVPPLRNAWKYVYRVENNDNRSDSGGGVHRFWSNS